MSILSTTELNFFTGSAIDLFNQASNFHTLIVHKRPTKTLININADSYNGYNNEDNPNNFTLVMNSGIYNVAVVSVKNGFESEVFDPVPIPIEAGNKIIKVNHACRTFIDNGVMRFSQYDFTILEIHFIAIVHQHFADIIFYYKIH